MEREQEILKLRERRHELFFEYAAVERANRMRTLPSIGVKIKRVNEKLYRLTGNEVYNPFAPMPSDELELLADLRKYRSFVEDTMRKLYVLTRNAKYKI